MTKCANCKRENGNGARLVPFRRKRETIGHVCTTCVRVEATTEEFYNRLFPTGKANSEGKKK